MNIFEAIYCKIRYTLSRDPNRQWKVWGYYWSRDTIRNEVLYTSRRKQLAKIIMELNPSSVLEIGCAHGENLKYIKKSINKTGVDISQDALYSAIDRVPEATFKKMGGELLEFKNKTFDIVFTSGVLSCVPRDVSENIIAEMTRVAKNYIVVLEYHSDGNEKVYDFSYADNWSNIFKKYGEIKKYEKIDGKLWICVVKMRG